MLKSSFLHLSICCALFFFQESHSQSEHLPPNIVPPSPEASALFKFTETPVNLSQGMATTEIPIYTIKTKGVTIPISLSYHSRGIKVAELASRVGLGWTLNHGGMISRQVRGKSDDGHPYGYLRQSYYNDFFTNVTTQNNMWNDDLNHGVDFDPDLFFFSFPGHSGKFIFNQATGQPWQQKYSDIKIMKTEENGLISSWTVKDDQGNTYYFGKAPGSTITARDSETTVNKKTTTNGFAILPADAEYLDYNTWHLLKIVTYEQEIINFTYELEEPFYVRRLYDQNDNEVPEGVVCYYSDVSANQYQIKKIDFPGGWVLFNEKPVPRDDLNNSYALDNIQVYAKDGSTSGSLVSQHNLSYQSVTSVSNNNYHSMLAISDGSSHKRMFLSSVTQIKGNEALPPYSFEYSNIKLPNRFSNSQDNWGYFNNANNGPYLSFYNYSNYGVNRRVDTIQNEAGLLKKMIYPTGGFVSYTYEQNVAVKPSFLDMTVSPGNNSVVSKSTGLGHLMQQNFDGRKYSLQVIIGENLQGSVKSSVSFSYGNCQSQQSTPYCGFPMFLENSAGTIFTIPYGNNIPLGLSPGTYELQVYPPGQDPTIYFTVNLLWEEEQPMVDTQGQSLMLASGKRIKKVTYSDGQSTVKTKQYSYNFPNGANSGKIFGLPSFFSIMLETSIGNILYKYGNRSGSPLSSLQGNDLGYGYVTEYEGTFGSNIGKTEYEFTNFSDEGTYYEFPYHLPIDNQWLRGKPLRTKFFKKKGSQYSLIKEIENTYLYGGTAINTPSLVGYHPRVPKDSISVSHKDRQYHIMPLAVFTPDDDQPDGHAFKVYYQLGGAFDLHSTTETSYLFNEIGEQQITASTIFNYDYSSHYQLKGTAATVNGETTETAYNYPGPTSTLGIANRLIPIERITSIKEGSTLLAESKQQTLFSTFGSLYLPSVIQSAKKGDTYQPRVEFTKYDNNGNPLEVAQYKGPTTVYIWGYNKQNPVAKIENSTYAAVENLSAFGAGFNLGSGGLNATQKSQLRGLAGALVNTYDYDPLVGVTVVTDANGKSTTYQFDPFNRLKAVYDHDGQILKQINYYFKNN